jgi:hypothetical protein
MFNFFRKFKTVSDTDGDGKGDREKAGSSPATPARKRDDKMKDKSSSREREVGVSSFDTKKTDLAAGAGVKRRDTERKIDEVEETVSVQQHSKKNEPVTGKVDEAYKEKVPVQDTSRAKVMGNATATMTSSDDAKGIGKNRDLAKSVTTHANTEASQDMERPDQHETAETWSAVSRRNFLSRASPSELTMVIKEQAEEQSTEENEMTRQVLDSAPSPGSQEKLMDMEKQVEQLENEK